MGVRVKSHIDQIAERNALGMRERQDMISVNRKVNRVIRPA